MDRGTGVLRQWPNTMAVTPTTSKLRCVSYCVCFGVLLLISNLPHYVGTARLEETNQKGCQNGDSQHNEQPLPPVGHARLLLLHSLGLTLIVQSGAVPAESSTALGAVHNMLESIHALGFSLLVRNRCWLLDQEDFSLSIWTRTGGNHKSSLWLLLRLL